MNISDILLAAIQTPRPRKEIVRASAFDLIQQFEDGATAAAIYTDDVIRSIWPHVPHMQPKPKTPWAWLCRALAVKDDPRVFLHRVHLQGSWLVASNGHSAHRIPRSLKPDLPGEGPWGRYGGEVEEQRGLQDLSSQFKDGPASAPVKLSDFEATRQPHSPIVVTALATDEYGDSIRVDVRHLLAASEEGLTVTGHVAESSSILVLKGPLGGQAIIARAPQ